MSPDEQALLYEQLTTTARDPYLFAHYNFPDAPPAPLRYVGFLEDATFTIYDLGTNHPVGSYAIQEENRQINVGGTLPPGLIYIAGVDTEFERDGRTEYVRLWKVVTLEADGYHFSQLAPRDPETGDPRLVVHETNPTALDPERRSPPFADLTTGNGALLWNASQPARRGEPEDKRVDTRDYAIHFVDLCVNFGLLHVRQSRARLDELESSIADPRSALFRRTVDALRARARTYRTLEWLDDLFKHLSYLITLHKVLAFGSPVGPIALALDRVSDGGARLQQLLTELTLKAVPELERLLVIDGKRYTIDEFRMLIEGALKALRRSAPLLGRLTWDEIADRTPAQIAESLQELVGQLKAHNRDALEMMSLSRQRIRSGLGSNTPLPIPVLHIPRIVKSVKKSEAQRMYDDGLYTLAVLKLLDNQAMMPLILAGTEIVFGIFCPPVGIALGICSAVLSDQEADFSEALANADYDVDRTLVSLADAADSRFWAWVDAIFVVADVAGGAIDVVKLASKSTRAAEGFEDVAGATRRIAGTGDDLPPRARLADVTDAEAARALEEAAARADVTADSRAAAALEKAEDLKEARQAAQTARKTGVDMHASRRVAASKSVDDALADLPPNVREQLGPDFDRIAGEYKSYFETRRAEIARGADLPQPRRFEEFAIERHRQITRAAGVPQVSAKQITRMQRRRARLVESMAGEGLPRRATLQEMLDLLDDTDELRKRLTDTANRSDLGRLRRGFSATENELLDELRRLRATGATDAQLDALIKAHLLDPLRESARRFGSESLGFAVFVHHAPNTAGWADDSIRSLKQLFDAPDIDKEVLDAILWQPAYRRLHEELIVSLERVRNVEGVFRPVEGATKLGANRSIVQRLVSDSISRGTVLEAIVLGRMAPELPPGTRVYAGFEKLESRWLESLQLEHGRHGRGSLKNLFDADIFVELPDGRRVFVDTKWVDIRGGRREKILRDMQLGMIWQLYKMDRLLSEGLVDVAEFWLSHHIPAELFDVAALRQLADRLTGKVRIVTGVFEDPAVLGDHFRRSVLNPDLPRPPTLPTRLVDAPARPPALPPPERRLRVDPMLDVEQPQRGLPSTRLARGAARVLIRLRHAVGDDDEQAIEILPRADSLADVRHFGLYRAEPDTIFNGRPAHQIVRDGPRDGDGPALEAALSARTKLTRVQPERGVVTLRYDSPTPLYVLAWEVLSASGTVKAQLRRYEPDGALGGEFPDEPSPLGHGWNLQPLFASGRLFSIARNAITTWTLLLTGEVESALTLELTGVERAAV